MLTDTHCHLNIMVKKTFDTLLNQEEIKAASEIITQAKKNNVSKFINVGTSLIESENCLLLAREYKNVFASVGIHPNDATPNWKKEFERLSNYTKEKEKNKIIGIGECGMDFHYPDFDVTLQKEVFIAHIELALKHDLPLIVHSRDAAESTLSILEEFKNQPLRGTVHCFSYDLNFAQKAIELGFVLGIDGPITYPKNDTLRHVVKEVGIENIILETDAPFLPPQIIRGKQNSPQYIKHIAEYIADLVDEDFQTVVNATEKNVKRIFNI